jgi:hypothetical protein
LPRQLWQFASEINGSGSGLANNGGNRSRNGRRNCSIFAILRELDLRYRDLRRCAAEKLGATIPAFKTQQ